MEKIKKFFDHFSDVEEYGRHLNMLHPPMEVMDLMVKYYREHILEEDVLDDIRNLLSEKGYKEYVEKADKSFLEFMNSIEED